MAQRALDSSMIALPILLLAVAALLHFFVSYCRSLVAVYSEVPVSEEALQLVDVEGRAFHGDEFRRIVRLISMCPERGDDRLEVTAVRAYYFVLNLLHLVQRIVPVTLPWLGTERAACAHFAAVALDRRIHSEATP